MVPGGVLVPKLRPVGLRPGRLPQLLLSTEKILIVSKELWME